MTTAILPVPSNFRPAGILNTVAAHDVIFFRPDEIEAYIHQHPMIGALLPAICKKAREVFGAATDLLMKVYRDPEIDDCYLTMYIRQQAYSPGILEKIDAVLDEFASEMEAASGFLLLTTDFRRPGDNDVV